MNYDYRNRILWIFLLVLFFSCEKQSSKWTRTKCTDGYYTIKYKSGDFVLNQKYWCNTNTIKYLDRRYKGKPLLKMFFHENGELDLVSYHNYKENASNTYFSFLKGGLLDTSNSNFIRTSYDLEQKDLNLKLITKFSYDSIIACKLPGSFSQKNFEAIYYNPENPRASVSDNLKITLQESDFLNDSMTICLYSYSKDSSGRFEVMLHALQFKNGEQYTKTTNLGVIR